MRIGVIGTGWGRMHVGGFRGAGAEIVGLCGRDRSKVEQAARQEGVPLATTEVGTLLAACDAVVVASPDGLHAEHARLALDAGRHVLCEKPLTRTWPEAQSLVAAAALRPDLIAAVNFPSRYLPAFAAARERFRARPPEQLRALVSSGFAAAEGRAMDGPLLGASGDFGGSSHVIDAALWMLGSEPAWVQAVLRGRPVHSVELQIGLASGQLAVVSHVASGKPGIWGRWQADGPEEQVHWEAGFVPTLGGWCLTEGVAEGRTGREGLSPPQVPSPGQREPWAQAHVESARAFLAAIERRAALLAPFADGARVQWVLEAAMRSEQLGRRVSQSDQPKPIPTEAMVALTPLPISG
jgi:myo-inositol 2-dehydrogenase/D-chiro-inositol 1-dehydrogenase